MRRSTLSVNRKWMYASAMTVCLAAAASSVVQHANARDALVQQQKNGSDRTSAEREAGNLLGKAEKPGNLEEPDWQRLVRIFHSRDARARNASISVMMCLGKSPRRDRILGMVRPLLTGADPNDKASALTLLMHFDTPDWRRQVALRESRSEPAVAYVVGLLKKNNRY